MTTPLPPIPPGAVLLTFDDVLASNRGVAAPQYNASASVERVFLTWDAIEGANPLRLYKNVKSCWPLAYVDPGAPLQFQFGGVEIAGDNNFVWSDPQPFDGTEETEQLNFEVPGRQIAMRVTYEGDKTFVLSGFDLDVEMTGRR